jgi:uncharacterized protein (TIGR00369 family)
MTTTDEKSTDSDSIAKSLLEDVPLLGILGIGVKAIAPGERVELEMRLEGANIGPYRIALGGAIMVLCDIAASCVSAINWRHGGMTDGVGFTTEEISVQFLAPGRVGPLVAVATTLRVSSKRAVASVLVCDTGNDSISVAAALASVRRLG